MLRFRLNEEQMKTSVNTGEVSLPQTQAARWSVKPPAQQGDGSEKEGFGVEKGLDTSSSGTKIAETTSKTQINDMNNRSNGKSRFKPFG